MRCRSLVVLTVLSIAVPMAVAQAVYTADRQVNVQIGAQFSLANPGISKSDSVLYGKWNYSGGGVYAMIDPHPRYGIELNARQLFGEYIGQRTFEAGPRYHRPLGPYVPYGKILFGRGFFNFPDNIGTLSFNEIAFGGGVDHRLSGSIHVRGDYEYQRWLGFSDKVKGFPGTLSPQVVSIGIAYHIQ